MTHVKGTTAPSVTPAPHPAAQTPPSPFGPVRKWGQPKPAPQPQPGLPGQRKPSGLTARPLSAAAQKQLADHAAAWDAHIDQVAATSRPARVYDLARLADAAHLTLDLAEYAEVA